MVVDAALEAAAADFANEIADLLDQTVARDSPIQAAVQAERIVVAAFNDQGDETGIPLRVADEERLSLHVRFLCTWDSSGAFLAITRSTFALSLQALTEPLVRFDYDASRTWAPSHVQVHGESSALGYALATQALKKPPKTQVLHIPTGGKRFRPALEDVLEFAIHDLAVEAKAGWKARVEDGRRKWRRVQLAAAIRDLLRLEPAAHEELRQEIEDIAASLVEKRQTNE